MDYSYNSMDKWGSKYYIDFRKVFPEQMTTDDKINDINNDTVNPMGSSGRTINRARTRSRLGLAVVGLQAVRQTINFATTNYGAFAQDSVSQKKINNYVSVGKMGAGIGAAFAFGGVITGAVALGLTALNAGFETAKIELAKTRSTASSQVLATRVGLYSTGGGRG